MASGSKSDPETNEDVPTISFHNYRYEINPTTGTLVLTEEEEEEDMCLSSDHPVPSGSGSDAVGITENRNVLKVLESGEVVMVTSSKEDVGKGSTLIKPDGNTDNLDGGNLEKTRTHVEVMDEDELEPVVEIINVPKPISSSVQNSGMQRKRNSCFWSQEKVDDLLHCIYKHARDMRRAPTKMKIWSNISKDMYSMGYSKCNRDECAKKWSNLYRTWRLINEKSKPALGSSSKNNLMNWQFYNEVNILVKIMNAKDEEYSDAKTSSSLKNGKSDNILAKMIEQSMLHQKNLEKAEAAFQKQVLLLDNERDELLSDIKNVLKGSLENSSSPFQGVNHNHIRNLTRFHDVLESSSKTLAISEPMFLIEIPAGTTAEQLVALLHSADNG